MKLAATIWGMRPLLQPQTNKTKETQHEMSGLRSPIHQHIQAPEQNTGAEPKAGVSTPQNGWFKRGKPY